MKLVSTACPNCGAKLQLNTDLRQASCDYCGHSFLIDDEVKRVSLEVQNGQQQVDHQQNRTDADECRQRYPEIQQSFEEMFVHLSIGKKRKKLCYKCTHYFR